jgi:RNA polymerase sigma-B factor
MKELFLLFHQTRNITIRNILVEQNLGLARKVAHQMANNSKETYEELEAWAIVGLIKGVERYVPEQGRYFTSFALPYIKGEILHYLRDKSSTVRIPRNLQEKASAKKKVEMQLALGLGRQPTNKEIMTALQLNDAGYFELLIASQNRRCSFSLDLKIPGTDDLMLVETLASPGANNHQEFDNLWLQLEKAISKISDRFARHSLALIYLDGISPPDVARLLQISIDELQKIVATAIKQLATHIEIDLEEIIKLVADYGEDNQINELWQLSSFGMGELGDRFLGWLYQSAAA